jgi:hypothetical protein
MVMIMMAHRQAISFRSYKNIQDSYTPNQRKTNKTIDQKHAWQQHDNPYTLE